MDLGLAETLTSIKGRLDGLDIIQLLRNPYFLVGSAVFCGVTLVRRMTGALVLFLVAIGAALLFHYAAPQGAGEIEGRSLVTFAGGGVAICAAIIYFFFIRSE